MKKHLILTLFFLSAIVLSATPKPGDADYFPFSAWGMNAWLDGPLTQEYFDDMAKAGITVAGFAVTAEELEMINKAGMTAWVHPQFPSEIFWDDNAKEEDVREAVRAEVEKFKDAPSFCGYYLQDEPKATRFHTLSLFKQELEKQDPAHRVYINLLPNYASPEQLGAKDFLEYAEKFVTEVHPDEIGYDFYTLFEDETAPLRPGYWKQLAETREVALKYALPMQVCVLAVGHMGYRVPTEADLFFEVYSALLYGAKGILYFTYVTPPVSSYRHSPCDPWGNRTETWYAMRYVNNTVKCIARTLNRLESTAVYHFQPEAPMDREDAAPADSLVMAPASPEQRVAIGEFRDKETGERYVMILNKDLKHTININNLQWRFGKPENLQVCSQYQKDNISNFGGENAFIAPGQALLLKL